MWGLRLYSYRMVQEWPVPLSPFSRHFRWSMSSGLSTSCAFRAFIASYKLLTTYFCLNQTCCFSATSFFSCSFFAAFSSVGLLAWNSDFGSVLGFFVGLLTGVFGFFFSDLVFIRFGWTSELSDSTLYSSVSSSRSSDPSWLSDLYSTFRFFGGLRFGLFGFFGSGFEVFFDFFWLSRKASKMFWLPSFSISSAGSHVGSHGSPVSGSTPPHLTRYSGPLNFNYFHERSKKTHFFLVLRYLSNASTVYSVSDSASDTSDISAKIKTAKNWLFWAIIYCLLSFRLWFRQGAVYRLNVLYSYIGVSRKTNSGNFLLFWSFCHFFLNIFRKSSILVSSTRFFRVQSIRQIETRFYKMQKKHAFHKKYYKSSVNETGFLG